MVEVCLWQIKILTLLTADDRQRIGPISWKALRRGVSHTDFDIDEIINSAETANCSQITQPRHCLHRLLPPKTSTHCPYSLRKRQHYQLSHVEYSQYKTVSSLVVCLTFDDCDMTVVMIMLKWRWIRLTDCIDYSFIAFFDVFYRSSLCILTARVTVCVCHARIKAYLLTYLVIHSFIQMEQSRACLFCCLCSMCVGDFI